ncbi:PREDICTED: uncharacterized protein LOC105362818 [Ceratosolen solmsi marchali]|uniref:Uncharacterized protein LOC105362818 n=1 Tax=Ceratosolen solmsi marchali TaxID=326594 RepID=A0AAJ7DW52_9HYME|nr:PREDICTED: uncharacterized protein LOC105362818 [Ceratosolen solmsi marchali]
MDNEELFEHNSSSENVNIEHKNNIKNRKHYLNQEEKEKFLKSQIKQETKKSVKQPRHAEKEDKFQKAPTTVKIYKILILLALFVPILGIFMNQNKFSIFMSTVAMDPGSAKIYVRTKLNDLKLIYKNQEDDLWNEILISIHMFVTNPTRPSIILLLGNEFQPLKCLATSLGNISSKVLDTDNVFLDPENFDDNTGIVIKSMQSQVQYKKVIIVWDLLNINVEALKAFHNFCDTINPLEKDVIYIISMIAENYENKITAIEFIETELWKKLSGKIKEDSIQPLITRITSGSVVFVNSEPTFTDC